MRTTGPASPRIELRAGTQQTLYMEAGTPLRVLAGSVLLTEPPCWLGETMQQLQRRLRRGESHVLTQRGWVRLQSDDEAVLA